MMISVRALSVALSVFFLSPAWSKITVIEHMQVGDGDEFGEFTPDQNQKNTSPRQPDETGQAAQKALEDVISATRAAFEAWTANVTDFPGNDDRYGLIPSATLLPAAGRLLISNKTTDPAVTSSCSGVLISPRHFLTAAHCVCGFDTTVWHYKDAEECQDHLSELKLRVFFPTAGVFDVSDTPIVHPDYRSIQAADHPVVRRKTRLADLAIVPLSNDVPIDPAPIGIPSASRRPLLASFGQAQFRRVPEGSSIPVDQVLQTGLKQVSKQRPPLLKDISCGPTAAADTFCTEYSDMPTDGEGADAGVCGGDSGAPLFDLDPAEGGAYRVVGVVARFSDSAIDCRTYRYSHFIELYEYQTWITQQISATKSTASSTRECQEALLAGGGTHILVSPRALFTSTSFKPASSTYNRPKITLVFERGDPVCNEGQEDQGAVACETKGPMVLKMSFDQGFAQVVLCRLSDK